MKLYRVLQILFSVLFLLPLSLPAMAATYYVSTTGNDTTGDGSLGTPWKTITHAAATIPAGTVSVRNEIIMAAGTYDAATNGETFPIILNNPYVSLLGDTSGITSIEAGGAPVDLLQVNATGITIQNTTFASASRGVMSAAGGLTLTDNNFAASIATGLYLYNNNYRIGEPHTTSQTVDAITLSGNTFNCTSTGAVIDVDLRYDYTTTGLAASLGGITASNNTFNINTGQTGFNIANYAVTLLKGGTITVGPVAVSGNTFTGGSYGFHFYGFFDYITDSNLSVGNFTVSTNTFTNQTAAGIYVDYYDAYFWYGASTGTLGNLTIQNNSITSSATTAIGIKLSDVGYLIDLYDSVVLTTGPIIISGNIINTGGLGIYMYYEEISCIGEYSSSDTAQVTFGATTISNNTVTSANDNGIYLYLYDIGYYMHGQPQVNFGAVTVESNTIMSFREGLYTEFDYVGYDMYDSSRLTMSPFTIRNNTITSTNYSSIYINYYDYDVGSSTYNNAMVTLPNWVITGNILDSTGGIDSGSGVYFYTYSNPYETYGNVATHFGSLLIDNNIFNPNKDAGMDKGVDLFIDDFCEGCYDASSATFGDITVSNNEIYNMTQDGINVWYGEVAYDLGADAQVTMGKSIFSGNTINGATFGIYLEFDDAWSGYSSTVTVGNMDFLDNTISNVTQMGIYFDLDATISNPDTATLSINRPQIKGNAITADPGGAPNGIYVFGDIDAGVTFGTPEITSNTVSGFTSGIFLDEGPLYNGLAGAQIQANTVLSNTNGLQINAGGSGYLASCNSITGNSTWGLTVNTGFAATVNAENNWWGDAEGPEACTSCNKVDDGDVGSVDFTPWLTVTPQKSTQCKEFYAGFSWPMFMPAITHPRP